MPAPSGLRAKGIDDDAPPLTYSGPSEDGSAQVKRSGAGPRHAAPPTSRRERREAARQPGQGRQGQADASATYVSTRAAIRASCRPHAVLGLARHRAISGIGRCRSWTRPIVSRTSVPSLGRGQFVTPDSPTDQAAQSGGLPSDAAIRFELDHLVAHRAVGMNSVSRPSPHLHRELGAQLQRNQIR